MPSNIEHVNISNIKLGIEDTSAGYIGHNLIYPNVREIQTGAYTDTSNISSSGGTRTFRVTGDIGSAYTLAGYGAGSYSLESSPYGHAITIGANTGCDAPSRTISTTLTPIGATTLQGGVPNFVSSFTQAASPNTTTNYNFNLSVSIVNTVRVTTVYNGVLMWATGAEFQVTYSGNNNSPDTPSIYTAVLSSVTYSNVTGSLTPGAYTYVAPGAFSGSYTATFTSPYREFQRASLLVNNATMSGCNEVSPSSIQSSNLYP